MCRYMIVGLGLLLGLGAAYAGEKATTRPGISLKSSEAVTSTQDGASDRSMTVAATNEPYKVVEAPPLNRCTTSASTELGGWHDVFVLENSDSLVLRRGAEVFMLAVGTAKPQKVDKLPDMSGTRIVFAGHSGKAIWLFCTSKTSVPFAVDLTSGKKVEFVIPRLKVPGKQSPVIRSWVVAAGAGGAVLGVSGGDKATWPRDGNRPIFFWFDLKSGRVVQMPVGYDLGFLSGDQTIAVFYKQLIEKFKVREKAALDMGTGRELERVFDRREKPWVSLSWEATRPVKALMAPEGPHSYGTSPDCDIIGVSVDGKMYPFSAPIGKTHRLRLLEYAYGWVGFRLDKAGYTNLVAPLFCGPVNNEIRLEQVGERIVQFKFLSKGRCLYVEGELGLKKGSCEAMVCDLAAHTKWNVLDGVERLPELDAALAAKPYVTDAMKVQLVASFGDTKRPRLVLCLFTHQRGEMRSTYQPVGPVEKTMPFQSWRRNVLVSGDMVRGQVSIFEGQDRPNYFWLHNSGRLFYGMSGRSADSGETGQINLHSIDISLEPEQLKVRPVEADK